MIYFKTHPNLGIPLKKLLKRGYLNWLGRKVNWGFKVSQGGSVAIDPKKQLPKGPQNSNEQFFDAIIRHQIFLLRVSGSITKDVIAILNSTEEELANRIRNDLAKIGVGLTPRNRQKLKRLMKEIQAIRSPAWDKIRDRWFEDFRTIVKNEPLFLDTVTKSVLPVTISPSLPSIGELTSMVTNNPFEGRTLSQWASKIERDDIVRIRNQITIGLVQGETGNQIARRVVGTARLRGTDGVTQITRREAATLTRTAVNAFSNMAKREFYLENKSIITGELYVATLDSRTTPICRSLDGKTFEVGIGPIPPLHFNCRSVRVAFYNNSELATRPSKPTTEKMLVREFAENNNLQIVSTRARLPRGFKGKFDKFSTTRTRELIGQVPAKVTYSEWLGRQSVSFQNDVLGVTKARLFRKGGVTLDKFVNRRGDELNLKQLVTKDRQAFIDAGLDPDNFN